MSFFRRLSSLRAGIESFFVFFVVVFWVFLEGSGGMWGGGGGGRGILYKMADQNQKRGCQRSFSRYICNRQTFVLSEF